jgi:hypothetical protein
MTAFLSEKFARIKLLLENPADGQLARLEKLKPSPWELKASERFGVPFLP